VNIYCPGYLQVNDMLIDSLNNLYMCGEYSGAFNFGIVSIPAPSNSFYSNMFIVKLDYNNQLQWLKNSNGMGLQPSNTFTNLSLDPSGYIYACGSSLADSLFIGNRIYKNGNARQNMYDCFIIKYQLDGTLKSMVYMDGDGSDELYSSAIDVEGNLIVTGSYSSSNLSFGNSVLHAANVGGGEVFIARIASSDVGVASNERVNKMNIFPNPTTSFIHIETEDFLDDFTLSIYNTIGLQVATQLIKLNHNRNLEIDLSSYSSGIYMLELRNKSKSYIAKIVKQ